MELMYDAFISYKRNGGTAWAELLFPKFRSTLI